MKQYVYVFQHLQYPFLYVGRTNNLNKRISEHLYSKTDNIDRKYIKLLLQSSVYYYETDNAAQSISMEAYLIDKYQPYLNKAIKYCPDNNRNKDFFMILPPPMIFNLNVVIKNRESFFEKSVDSLEHKIKTKQKQIQELSVKETILESLANSIPEKINTPIPCDGKIIFETDQVSFIIEKLSSYTDMEFFAAKYDTLGNMVSCAKIMYINNEVNSYVGRNFFEMTKIENDHWYLSTFSYICSSKVIETFMILLQSEIQIQIEQMNEQERYDLMLRIKDNGVFVENEAGSTIGYQITLYKKIFGTDSFVIHLFDICKNKMCA